MKKGCLLIIVSLLMPMCYAQVNDTITVAYMGVESYEVDFSTIKKMPNTKISEYQGNYHFGESESESQLEIICSNGKLYVRSVYYDFQIDNWVLKRDRQPIKYKNGKIEIGKISYELYECTKTTDLINAGEKVLVSHVFENLNDKTRHNIQLNFKSKIEVPKGKYPETSFVKLYENDLTAYTKNDLKIMRNEIFARNGYIFKKESEIDTYFSKQEWYNALNKTGNPNLDAIEKHNVSLLKKLEENLQVDNIKLGEDIAEINGYVKKIYRKDKVIYVDIDVVQITHTSAGERIISNKNPKIRTYIVDDSTIIYGHDCKNVTPEKLLEIEKSVLDDESIIVVGSSKNGVLKSINFGCYG